MRLGLGLQLTAEERAHDDIVSGLEAAVHAQHDAIAQLVEHERLLGLGSEFRVRV